MKKRFLPALVAVWVVFFSVNVFAQTAGTLTFTFTEAAHSVTYNGSAQHSLALWIQTGTGTGTSSFVKTRLRYWGGAASKTGDHLPSWVANTGSNATDAVTGATLASWTTKTITWDGKIGPVATATLVPDGQYRVTLESCWDHGTAGIVVTSFAFTKGSTTDHQTPTNTANFTNIKLDWVPLQTAPTASTSIVNVKCKGDKTGLATANVTGAAPYTYSWSTSPVQTTATATGLAAGTYSVTVQNANGTTTAMANVTEPATAITNNVTTTTANCGLSNGSASATASGGTGSYTYLWSNSKTTSSITGLVANVYSVTVTDGNGCKSSGIANVLNSGAPTASVTPTNVTGCFGGTNGSAIVTVSGGTGALTYSWNTTPVKTTASITGLAAGVYDVIVADASSCSVKATTVISQPTSINASLNVTNLSSCTANDGVIIATVSGGSMPYSYLWSNNKTTTSITGLTTGTYSLTVTDLSSCKLVSVGTVSCTTSIGNDIGITAIVAPNGTICGSNLKPTVTVKNLGTTILTSCTILYRIDANSNQTYNWNGSLASGASANVNLPVITSTLGSHIFYCLTNNPNGVSDINTANDQYQSNFSITNISASVPVMEGFESGTSLPVGWTLSNPDNDAAWEISTTIFQSGNNSIGFNNCEGNGVGVDMKGTKDRLVTNVYDFSSATSSANLSFNVAYAVLDYKGQIYTDSLAIYASTDCGSTWNKIYNKGGTSLSNIKTTLSCWSPVTSDWSSENINLANFAGQPGVMFAFENRSDWGEWIYLDNINITAITGIEAINPLAGFSIFPNPASTSFTIEGVCNRGGISYSVLNFVGAEIVKGEIKTTGETFSEKILVNDMPKGMYFIKISDGKDSWTKKISVQ
jgi:hypothetical protein